MESQLKRRSSDLLILAFSYNVAIDNEYGF